MAVATPAVPASTVAVANTTGQMVTVVITGGTMTNVSVNGSTVGAGAGSYELPPGGSVTMTYSVAPTWAWSDPLDASGEIEQGGENTGAINQLTDELGTAHSVGGESGLGIAEDN